MAFFQMDDGFETEARVMRAGRPAFGLYAACGIWVARHLTDGFIPAEIAALYGTREWIERLVTTGLWVAVDGGFVMPDYLVLHANPTAETVRKRRADAALRKQRQRDKTRKPPNGGSRGESRVTGTVTHGGSPASLASPPPKGGEVGDAPPPRSGASPTSTPTHKLTSGRVICATHQLEIADGGTCRGCAADARVNDDLDDLDQRPPTPSLGAVALAPPAARAVTDDDGLRDQMRTELAAARRTLARVPDADRWLDVARGELVAAGVASPPIAMVTTAAAELYRRAADNTTTTEGA